MILLSNYICVFAERGDYVVRRDDEEMEGVYFVLEGQV